MSALLLSAGQATRLGDIAPAGCKAMTIVGGLTMIDWWSARLGGRPTVVCRGEHLSVIPDDVDTIVCDEGGGPARALAKALPLCAPDEPVTVAYADTWLRSIPDSPEWCLVAAAPGGRAWDIVEDGFVSYADVPADETALVCVGAYRFAEPDRLEVAVDDALRRNEGDVGMGEVINRYGLPFLPADAWQDVGDRQALGRWRAA